MQIAVLMTCFNRKEKTLASLKALASQRLPDDVSSVVYLVDAGSSDGTVPAIQSSFPSVRIIEADPSFFWNAGMRLALESARSEDKDFYLWLNDDTILDDTAIDRLLRTRVELQARRQAPVIVAGCTRDQAGTSTTYGGHVRRGAWRPLKFDQVPVSDVPVQVDTMNGNCVLLPESIVATVGNLDPSFVHSLGDFDYGLRARAMGFEVWMAPGSIGTCESNSPEGTWQDSSLGLKARWRKIKSPKGIPPSEWRVFARRYGGVIWPVYWASPYLKLLLSAINPLPQDTTR